ncbi:MAG: hypothetical protein COZ08_00380, partial [Bacteroidetes bacterium CG_4_10_14_3_um_filter_42_6]
MKSSLLISTLLLFSINLVSQEYIACARKEKEWGYVGKDGKWVINPQFESAANFNNKLARVKSGGEWGYINDEGKYIINPQCNDAEDFSEGLAPVKKDKFWGYIDKKGSWAINNQFDLAM